MAQAEAEHRHDTTPIHGLSHRQDGLGDGVEVHNPLGRERGACLRTRVLGSRGREKVTRCANHIEVGVAASDKNGRLLAIFITEVQDGVSPVEDICAHHRIVLRFTRSLAAPHPEVRNDAAAFRTAWGFVCGRAQAQLNDMQRGGAVGIDNDHRECLAWDG